MDAEKGSVARWGLHCLLRLDRIESGEVLMKEETKMRTTAQVLVDCLEAEGVDVIFGIPGEETLDLMFAIRDSKIRFIPVRHEQGAAFMADVYGRLTGRAGVCLSTLGPGATNLVTGVADALFGWCAAGGHHRAGGHRPDAADQPPVSGFDRHV